MDNGYVIMSPIYNNQVIVYKGDDRQKMLAYFNSQFSEGELDIESIDSMMGDDYAAQTIKLPNGDILVHFKSYSVTDINQVVHESFHVVEYTFDYVGIKHGRKSSEAWAYYLGFITERIYNN